MLETFPVSQWGDVVDEGNQKGVRTRALRSNEIVRWRERVSQNAPGVVIESLGLQNANPIPEKTMGGPEIEVRVPRFKKAGRAEAASYILLKKYEGFVSSKGTDSFTARLYENRSDYPVIEAEFDFEELLEADRKFVVEGAPLVWTIGYRDAGSRRIESEIYMRRLPEWGKSEVEQARRESEELTRDIQWR